MSCEAIDLLTIATVPQDLLWKVSSTLIACCTKSKREHCKYDNCWALHDTSCLFGCDIAFHFGKQFSVNLLEKVLHHSLQVSILADEFVSSMKAVRRRKKVAVDTNPVNWVITAIPTVKRTEIDVHVWLLMKVLHLLRDIEWLGNTQGNTSSNVGRQSDPTGSLNVHGSMVASVKLDLSVA